MDDEVLDNDGDEKNPLMIFCSKCGASDVSHFFLLRGNALSLCEECTQILRAQPTLE